MAQFNVNDTIGLMMRLLNNHAEIIRLWHEVSSLLQKLGLLPAGVAAPAKATHAFDVQWMQRELNRNTGSKLKVDGVIGPATLDAVRVYQGKRGLSQDGWPGPLTLAQLEKDMGP